MCKSLLEYVWEAEEGEDGEKEFSQILYLEPLWPSKRPLKWVV